MNISKDSAGKQKYYIKTDGDDNVLRDSLVATREVCVWLTYSPVGHNFWLNIIWAYLWYLDRDRDRDRDQRIERWKKFGWIPKIYLISFHRSRKITEQPAVQLDDIEKWRKSHKSDEKQDEKH